MQTNHRIIKNNTLTSAHTCTHTAECY